MADDWLPMPAARRGLFWMVPILLLATALVAGLMYREGVWVTRDQLHFRTDSAEGLAKGMPVKLHGFAVGTVTAVELNPDSNQASAVLVRLAIERRFMSLIPRGSVISTAQEGLIGQNFLLIKPPTADTLASRSVADGEQLPFERPKALSEIASEMARKVEPFVAKAGELTSSLADPNGDLRQLMHNSRLASEQAPVLVTQMNSTLNHTDQVLTGVQTSVNQLNQRLPQLLLHTEKTLAHAEATSGELRQLTERHGEATLSSAQNAAQNADEVLSSARKRWPLRQLAPTPGYQSPEPGSDILPVVTPATTRPTP